MIVYSVLAQRYGDKEGHHYIVGVFKERDHAVNCGEAERLYRGGKYECMIIEMVVVEEDLTEINDKDYVSPKRVYKDT